MHVKRNLAALAAAACLAAPAIAGAAAITWGSAQTIASDSDVSSAGTLVRAYDFYAGASTTINTVTFSSFYDNGTPGSSGYTNLEGDVLSANWHSPYNDYMTSYQANPPAKNISSEYAVLLTNGPYTNGTDETATLTLGSVSNPLTVGDTYTVEVWVNDSRSGKSTETQTVSDNGGGGNSVVLYYTNTNSSDGVGEFAVGTFTASSTSQAILFTPLAATLSQLNGIELRDTTVPEPMSAALLTMGFAGLALRRRRGTIAAR